MASSSAMLKIFCLGMLGLLILAPYAEAVIGCSLVLSSLNPCLGYIGGQPLNPQCCSNIRSLYGEANTKPDHQGVCNCLKSLAGIYRSSIIGKVKEIVSRCGVNIGYSIDPSIDCTMYVKGGGGNGKSSVPTSPSTSAPSAAGTGSPKSNSAPPQHGLGGLRGSEEGALLPPPSAPSVAGTGSPKSNSAHG